MKIQGEVANILPKAIDEFLKSESELILTGIAERTLCGRLGIIFHNLLKKHKLTGYYCDVEFNRMGGGRVKTIISEQLEYITVNCDVIVHSRGKLDPDNLIAIEMKKSEAKTSDKLKDKNRLIALTKKPYQDIWSEDGVVQPEYVCGYLVGLYMELDLKNRTCTLLKYQLGNLEREWALKF